MGRLSMGESLTGPKVPGREEAVNDGPQGSAVAGARKQALEAAARAARRADPRAPRNIPGGVPIGPASAGIPWPGWAGNP